MTLDRRVAVAEIRATELAQALHEAGERDVLPSFRKAWEDLRPYKRRKYLEKAGHVLEALRRVIGGEGG